MKRVRDILKGVNVIGVTGDDNILISDIEFDSRKVVPGVLFVAVRGTASDGHDFIQAAVAAGAAAVICERMPSGIGSHVCRIITDDSAAALGMAASNFYDNPSSSLKLVGVTGTNGKTTIATLLYRMFTELGYKCGLFSTVCNYIAGREIEATHTTPDPVQLNRIMSEMTAAGCDFAFMEVSSHAIHQQRIAGLEFAGGIFTNLTHDHLDYHLTFAAYLEAKKRFFDLLPESSFALVNNDDRNGKVMLQNCKGRHFTYSIRGMADFRGGIVEQTFEGMAMKVQEREVWTRFIGDFNASNLLAVCAASELLGGDREEILKVLSSLRPVPGRLETVSSPAGITGLVDYAHTPDALLNVIETINKMREGGRQLITVVGAGGDRDKTKRPKMASISAEGSTRLILTSDNPRTEDPEKILDDMESGIAPEMKKKTLRISDRRQAIKTAVMLANAGDIILVAGKGHETYQDVKGVKHHFDDREELKAALQLKQ